MGWFSPVKGTYPDLAQVDKTLPVKGGVKTIERGTIVTLKADSDGNSAEGVWDVAGATDKLLYIALQDYTDPTAGYAGTAFDPNGGVPRINALALDMDAEYETSVFDLALKNNCVAGDPLKVVNGRLAKASGGDNVIGYVTLPPTERWINNAIAVPADVTDQRLAVRTGANKFVLRFRTK